MDRLMAVEERVAMLEKDVVTALRLLRDVAEQMGMNIKFVSPQEEEDATDEHRHAEDPPGSDEGPEG